MVENHRHTGTDSNQIFGGDLLNAPRQALTAPPSSAGATYTATEQTAINTNSTRILEIENALVALGLLKPRN